MKNFFAALIITGTLIAFFSTAYSPVDLTLCSGPGIKIPGAAGVVIPGNGSEPAEIMAETPQEVEATTASKKERSQASQETKSEKEYSPVSQKTKTNEEPNTETKKEEQNKMDGMVISFWHGVVAVLIGESSALAVAAAWMKIKGAKAEK